MVLLPLSGGSVLAALQGTKFDVIKNATISVLVRGEDKAVGGKTATDAGKYREYCGRVDEAIEQGIIEHLKSIDKISGDDIGWHKIPDCLGVHGYTRSSMPDYSVAKLSTHRAFTNAPR